MGSRSSTPSSSTINHRIEKQIEKDKENFNSTIKLLLLGSGESGKSTVLKQMRILHSNGFAQTEFEIQKAVIHENVMSAIVSLISAMSQLQLCFDNEESTKCASFILVHNEETKSNPSYNWQFLDTNLVEAISKLWQDFSVQECFKRRSEFQLLDSAKFFLDEVDRIGHPDYCPTEADILHSRSQTSSIVEVSFEISETKFKVFDVGGQRSCRRKWIHCFDNVNAIIFIVAISEYDMNLREDRNVNRMVDSLLLFEGICACRWFTKTSIILFLNKKDIFADKIAKKPISIAFPEYTGPQSYSESLQYISLKFAAQNKEARRSIYEHVTCATDRTQMQFVLDSVARMIIKNNLAGMGLMED